MLFGSTPFKGITVLSEFMLEGKSQDDTFSKILDAELDFPESHAYPVTSTCKSLIKKLLSLDPKKRLGYYLVFYFNKQGLNMEQLMLRSINGSIS